MVALCRKFKHCDQCEYVDTSGVQLIHFQNSSVAYFTFGFVCSQADDDLWRLKEGLVRYFISSVASNVSIYVQKKILNPNEVIIALSNIFPASQL